MHCLVTGAQGFLGAQVVRALREAGAVVTATGRRPAADVVGCDLSVASDVAHMVKKNAPDCIVHCAAHVPKNPEEYQDGRSATASLRMLEAVLLASDCPFVFISSMTVYGIERDRPVVEEDVGDPSSAYGRGKLQAERCLMADGRPALAVRIPGLFGPKRREGLVCNLLDALNNGRTPRLPEEPVLWAGMHVEDAAVGIAKLALSEVMAFEAVNLGYHGFHSINNLIRLAGEICGDNIDCAIRHPSFAFNLARAERHNAGPAHTLRDAMMRFHEQI